MPSSESPTTFRSIPARRLKSELAAVVEGVTDGHPTLITHKNRPVAVLMPIDQAKFEKWLADQAPDFVQKAPMRTP